ncbi:MAG: hypothetical protein ACLVAA_03175 [Ruthenibacterium sp.]
MPAAFAKKGFALFSTGHFLLFPAGLQGRFVHKKETEIKAFDLTLE